jgi:hypothetical protein
VAAATSDIDANPDDRQLMSAMATTPATIASHHPSHCEGRAALRSTGAFTARTLAPTQDANVQPAHLRPVLSFDGYIRHRTTRARPVDTFKYP